MVIYMMTEIRVIVSEPTIKLDELSPRELESLFEQVMAPTGPPMLFRNHLDNFLQMYEELQITEIADTKPELKELLLRKIIHNPGNGIPIIAFPIITKIINDGNKGIINGNIIKVRFDDRVNAIDESGLSTVIPPGEEVDIVGIMVYPLCTNYVNKSFKYKIIPGRYLWSEAVIACDGYFMAANPMLKFAGSNYKEPTRVLFSEDKLIEKTLSDIFDYARVMSRYLRRADSAHYIYSQPKAVMDRIYDPNKKEKIRSLISLYDLFDTFINAPPVILPPGENIITGPISDILDLLETIHHGRFSRVFMSAVIADVDSRGFNNIYNNALLNGIESSKVTDKINEYKELKTRIAFNYEMRQKLLEERNKFNVLRNLIEKKYGIVVPQSIQNIKNMLKLLEPRERDIIMQEYNKREEYLNAVINNKCPHVALYRKFRRTSNISAMANIYKQLSAYFDNNSAPDGMILCNNCGFDIICPHVRELTELNIRPAPPSFGEMRARLTKYIYRAPLRSGFKQSYSTANCKICGETILQADEFDSVDEEREAMMDEELKNFMWSEMATLIKYLSFGRLVNVPKLITAMRDACYPYIFEIEKQILKSKTNSADEVKAKKRLFITIYAFAYLIHIMTTNTNVTFKNLQLPPDNRKALVVMIKHAVSIILMARNVIIREIPGMTPDTIKNKIIEAYKSISSGGPRTIVSSSDAEDIVVSIIYDPVYKYIYEINLIDSILRKKSHDGRSESDLVSNLNTLLGKSITSSSDIYANIKIPNFAAAEWRVSEFDGLSGAPPILNKLSAYISGYLARSFDIFSDRFELYKHSPYADITAGDIDDPTAFNVTLSPLYEKYTAKYNNIALCENILQKFRKVLVSPLYSRTPGSKILQVLSIKTVPLGRLYDAKGQKHVFDIYIYEGGNSEISGKSITSAIESGDRAGGAVIDRKCSVCGILKSAADDIPEQEIRKSLLNIHIYSNFFRFYEKRCPEGGLHTTDAVCAKCGLPNTIIDPTNMSPNELKYYKKYKDKYKAERDEFSDADTLMLGAPPTIPQPHDPTIDIAALDKWTFNFNIILDLANKLKINPRLISAMGAVEKQEYNDVQSGAYIPPETEYKMDTRIYFIDTNIKNLITRYNQVRFFSKLIKPPLELIQLIDNSGISRHKVAELSKKLPDIYNDYDAKLNYIQKTKKPREIVSFVLQIFCELCLNIWNNGEKDTERLRQDFVDYFVKKVLREEELLSKPGHFNWSLLYGDSQEKTYDSNYDDKKPDRRHEDSAEPPEDTDVGDTAAPLSLDSFDMEEDPDRDPMDDESNDQMDWNAGDEYGL